MMRIAFPLAAALALGGCSLSSILGGGGKAPASLFALTSTAPAMDTMARTVNAGQAVTIETPAIDKEIDTTRVAVTSGQDVLYVTELTMVDKPDKQFQELVAETVRRTTSRVVLDPGQARLDPGIILSGKLQKFGYDVATGMVTVQYDGALSTGGGAQVEARRFTATAPADGTAATVGPALNEAANKVATDIAGWIGS